MTTNLETSKIIPTANKYRTKYGFTWPETARELNNLGFRTKTGKRITNSYLSFLRVAKNKETGIINGTQTETISNTNTENQAIPSTTFVFKRTSLSEKLLEQIVKHYPISLTGLEMAYKDGFRLGGGVGWNDAAKGTNEAEWKLTNQTKNN